jgi:hypothetical protein
MRLITRPSYVVSILILGGIGLFMLLPSLAVAAGLVPCGGPGEPECQACHITQLINNVVAWLFVVFSIVAAIMIAIAGMKMVTGGSNPGTLESAKQTLTNIIIGFIILMGGWIIVDTLMKALVSGQVYGIWNQIQCVSQPGVNNAPAGSGLAPGTPRYTGVIGGGRGPGAQCAAANITCSVDALVAAGFTPRQANIMSCIAMTESTGNPLAINRQSGACGTFQVLRSTWESVRNRPPGCESFSQCTNYNCNVAIARELVGRSRTEFSDWTCPNCNSRAQACINQYGGQGT